MTARLAMAELAAARVEVEAVVATDAARAAVAELEVLHVSSTDSSVFADDDRDNELKLVREAAREQAVLRAGLRAATVPPTAVTAQTGMDAPATGLTEIATLTDDAALPPRTGIMVTMGSRPLSGTSVPVAGGLPSPRPTTSSGPR
jgi:hypothetical protein